MIREFEELLGKKEKPPIDRNYSVPCDAELKDLIEDAKVEVGSRIVNEAIRIMIREGLPKLLEQSKKKSA
jgi:hypothetical protein